MRNETRGDSASAAPRYVQKKKEEMMTYHASKPTLMSMKQGTTVTTRQLAEAADISLGQTYTVEIGGFSDEITAWKVVRAFERLSGIPLKLDDIARNNTMWRQNTKRRVHCEQ